MLNKQHLAIHLLICLIGVFHHTQMYFTLQAEKSHQTATPPLPKKNPIRLLQTDLDDILKVFKNLLFFF